MDESRDHVERLLEAAEEAKSFAYVPYSDFPVGASVMTKKGDIYTGCNIENASYGLTNCAERTALFNAVSNGETEFLSMGIISDSNKIIPPCGACRQVIYELCGNITLILSNNKGTYKLKRMEELLPGAFSAQDLKK